MFDVNDMVTNRIIEMLEKGVVPWEKPWVGGDGQAVSRTNGKPYSFMNQMLLCNDGEYATFKQITEEGGKIKKGAKGKIIVFWKIYEKKDGDNPEIVKQIPILKYYNVFRIGEDTEQIEPKHFKREEYPTNSFEQIEEAERKLDEYLEKEKCGFKNVEGSGAYYSPSEDTIVLPIKDQFKSNAEYYSTAFHEAVHSTGHSSRLDRLSHGMVRFGSDVYSKEELVAEIGSAAIMNSIGIETDKTFRNSVSYIQSWIKALKDDKTLIVGAASKAQKAVEMILGVTDEEETYSE